MARAVQRISRRRALAWAAGLSAAAVAARAQDDGEGGRGMDDKVALVTGSTDGLGREVARRLGALGWTVLTHGRSAERGAAVVREIRDAGGQAEFFRADFASLAEVEKLAETLLERSPRLDLLINNAGIWTDGGERRRESADGHELVLAVNYLAGLVLTQRLLPLLERSAPARIVNVSSLAQQPIDFDDPMLTKSFSAGRAYAQSKLAQLMFTIDLAAALDPNLVTVNALHPATLMNTTMVERAGATPRSTIDEGAAAVMHLAVAPELAGRTGLFFNGRSEGRGNAQAYDADAQARLRALSREWTGIGER